MDADSQDESRFIFDDYHHSNPVIFYTVTRLIESIRSVDCFDRGCDCDPVSRCTNENDCSCLRYGINYGTIVEGDRAEMVLADDKLGNLPVFECNRFCSCYEILKNSKAKNKSELISSPEMCRNRNVQFGPIDCLEIFTAGKKGLGLRTGRKIFRGSFICEYAGESIDLEEAKKRQKRQEETGEMNFVFVLREHAGSEVINVTCVDPGRFGNVGRYINHCCQPNSAIVPVRVNDSIPLLCVFAIRDIEPGEEISFDYSGGGNSSEVTEGKRCHCEAPNCRKFLPFQSEI